MKRLTLSQTLAEYCLARLKELDPSDLEKLAESCKTTCLSIHANGLLQGLSSVTNLPSDAHRGFIFALVDDWLGKSVDSFLTGGQDLPSRLCPLNTTQYVLATRSCLQILTIAQRYARVLPAI
jgi:hypothetical protein